MHIFSIIYRYSISTYRYTKMGGKYQIFKVYWNALLFIPYLKCVVHFHQSVVKSVAIGKWEMYLYKGCKCENISNSHKKLK